MTVKELIDELQKMPPDVPVTIYGVSDYCYEPVTDLELIDHSICDSAHRHGGWDGRQHVALSTG